MGAHHRLVPEAGRSTLRTRPGARRRSRVDRPAAYVFDGADGPSGLPTFQYPYANPQPDVLEDQRDYADGEARLENARTWEWMHPLDDVLGSLRAAGLSIEEFTEHYRVPWQIFPVTVAQGDGMFGWPAERWLPLSYEVVASTPLR